MILQALDRYYDRMAARGEAELPGWARAPIGWVIEISTEGEPVSVMQRLDPNSRKPRPAMLSVPAAVPRRSNILPNRFWDKTEYALGVTSEPDEKTAKRHASFRSENLNLIGDSGDAGLFALGRFLKQWHPGRFATAPFRPEMLDGNVAFRLQSELGFIHDRAAAKALLRSPGQDPGDNAETCLITGERALPRRLHPDIKGVYGAKTTGSPLVSFNLDAFKSYGKEQGANAPTSEAAAERYGAALNAMLASGERNRLRRGIGDASVVFWADASGAEETAAAAEDWFATIFASPDTDSDGEEAAKLGDTLKSMAEARPALPEPKLPAGVRFHVLGLSPNAARLSVRFWLSDSFDAFARHLLDYMDDIRIEPPPRGWTGKKGPPEIWRLLVKTTALQEKFENVPPMLAGELARAILGGQPFPRTWLLACITRLRAGDDPAAGWHAAGIKACLNRNRQEENLPVALEPNNPNPAYQLGRLFAAIEQAQYAALGRVNATVADRFYGAASSTPARVFPSLLRNARNHVSDVKRRGGGGWLERKLDEIIGHLGGDLPRMLRLEDQGRFAVGYYHERAFRPAKPTPDETDADTGAPE